MSVCVFARQLCLCGNVHAHASPIERKFMSAQEIEYISQAMHSLHKTHTSLPELVPSLSWTLSFFYILFLQQQNQKLRNSKHKKLSTHMFIKYFLMFNIMKAIKHIFSPKKISLIFIVHSSGGAIASITFELVKIFHECRANWSLVKKRAIKTRPLSLSFTS